MQKRMTSCLCTSLLIKGLTAPKQHLLMFRTVIRTSIDRHEIILLGLSDLSAAFDTVDKNVLLEILTMDFNVSAEVLRWLNSYLTGQVQKIQIGAVSSEYEKLKCGVP